MVDCCKVLRTGFLLEAGSALCNSIEGAIRPPESCPRKLEIGRSRVLAEDSAQSCPIFEPSRP